MKSPADGESTGPRGSGRPSTDRLVPLEPERAGQCSVPTDARPLGPFPCGAFAVLISFVSPNFQAPSF
jgi:hypothetical protein